MNANEEIIERISFLIRKKTFDKLSDEEEMELKSWLLANKDNQDWFNKLQTLEISKNEYLLYKKISSPEDAWNRLERATRKRSINWKYITSIAAMIAVVLGVTLMVHPGKDEKQQEKVLAVVEKSEKKALISLLIDDGHDSCQIEVRDGLELSKSGLKAKNKTLTYDSVVPDKVKMEYHTLEVGKGANYRLVLSDGTVVWLNSESSLRYPAKFAGNIREVELKGEAFFDVSHDESKPFKVYSGNFDVEVLGTTFNIMNYENENLAHVTLATGKLRVNRGIQHAMIHPDQQVQLSEKKFAVYNVDATYYTTWMNDKFMFDEEELESIVRKLSRWYNVEFEFEDEALKYTRFTGQLKKYEDISKALELLSLTTDIDFNMNYEKIFIMHKRK